nr:hemolysin III family protein [Haloferula luteola]
MCASPAEESASMWSHIFGTVLAIIGLVVMLLVSDGDARRVVSASIFGGTLVLLYLSSSIYHAFSSPKLKELFQIFDHACIYLLIAGSYTPLTLVCLRGAWGWSIFGVVWFLAVAGVVLKAVMRGKREAWWSTALYLAMGWLIVIAAGPLIRNLPTPGLIWLIAGGVGYSLGTIFFAWEKLPYNHAIWHGFVILGSACHVVATAGYILN